MNLIMLADPNVVPLEEIRKRLDKKKKYMVKWYLTMKPIRLKKSLT